MKSELPLILRHAVTVLAGQLAVMAYGVTDTIVAGRHSQEALAALSIGSAVFVSVYVALMGILQAILPIWAEQRGAGRDAAIGASVRQSLYLCAAASVLGMAVLLSPGPILEWTDVPPQLRGEVRAYLAVLAFGLPAALLFRIYSTLSQALGHPQLVTWLQVGALFIKLPLSVWLTFGGAGVPALGVVGCAWATLAV
ncbi:MATE family efflux transporter, partial [Melaminivora alkalimesophila]